MLTVVTAPTGDVLGLDEAREQLRITETTEDGLVNRILDAARDRAELATGRQLLTATYDLELDQFPSERWIELPRPPLISVTSVKYLDTAGVLQTWAPTNYTVKAPAGPRCARGRVVLNYSVDWPTTQDQTGAVVIRFLCGYGSDPATVPSLLKTAILLDVGTLSEHREDVITGTIVASLPLNAAAIYRGFKSHPRQVLDG